MTDCSVSIDHPEGVGPVLPDWRVSALRFWGRVSPDCRTLHVTVRLPGPDRPVLFERTLYVGGDPALDPSDPNNRVIWEFVAPVDFTDVEQLPLGCGAQVVVHARCTSGASCESLGVVTIQCKHGPGQIPPRPDPRDPPPGWWFPWPPGLHCSISGRGFAQALHTTLLAFVAWASSAPPAIALLVTACAGTGTVIYFWWAWLVLPWCSPSHCIRRGVMLWAFKRAVIGGAIIIVAQGLDLGVAAVVPAVVLVVCYGIVCGWLEGLLERDRCPIPAADASFGDLGI